MASSRAEQIETLADLIDEIEICMLTTLDNDGKPWSRPMRTQRERFDGALWFFTRDDSEKVDHVHRDRRAGAAFALPSEQQYVTMAGTATVVRDREKAEALWSPENAVWFPDGLDDPHLCLLKLDVDRAEYWDSPTSFVTYALGFVKTKLTGDPPDLSENEKVDVS